MARNDPTVEEVRNDQFNRPTGVSSPLTREKEIRVVNSLESFRIEAETARKSGPNDRDTKWRENLDLYWNRYDFKNKKSWQAKEVMPEVPAYVDRFSAALKDALMSNPQGFYTVVDPADTEGDIAQSIKRATDVWLSRTGRNQMGQLLPFSAIFEEQMKLGAIMATSNVVTWKSDVPDGRVAVETVDPRMVFLDPSYRNLYRIRRLEMDLHDVRDLVTQMDGKDHLFNVSEVEQLVSSVAVERQREREELTGHGQQMSSGRSPIIIDEYVATVIDEMGKAIVDRKALYMVANNKFLIRGPEKNPFWHGSDWLVFSPLIPVPLSVYGRSYMEDFGSVAKTFTELTNLLLDAVHVSALKAWVMVPEMLVNPGQIAEGIQPNKIFQLEGGADPKMFAQELALGAMAPESIKMWEAIKGELVEAARINEIGLGQFAPNSRTSATEVSESQHSSSALIRSVAQTVETRYLDPTLDLIWKTGVQHVKPNDARIRLAMGEEWFSAMITRRREFASKPFTFQARGISEMLARSAMLKSLLTLVQFLATNEVLLKEFLGVISIEKLVTLLFRLSNIDLKSIEPSQRERMMKAAAEPLAAAGAEQSPGGGTTSATGSGEGGVRSQMGSLASSMGVAK